jgi:hypothetical protein
VTTIHRAMLIWRDMGTTPAATFLADSGLNEDRGLWAVVQALGEVVPDGEAEQMLAHGLGGNRSKLSSAAPSTTSSQTAMEFDND